MHGGEFPHMISNLITRTQSQDAHYRPRHTQHVSNQAHGKSSGEFYVTTPALDLVSRSPRILLRQRSLNYRWHIL